MAADAAQSPPWPEDRLAGTDTFTSERIERIVTFVIGVGSAALAVQSFLVWLGSSAARDGVHLALAAVVFASLLLMVIACLAGRLVAPTSGLFALVFPIALVVWPMVAHESPGYVTDPSWTWFLLNISTVAAVVAFPLAAQIVWAVGVPVLYGAVRAIDLGGQRLVVVALDVVFALILGAVLVSLGWMLRAMARDIDRARVEAITAFAEVAEADAAEKERVAVAALMHDSVLAALIAASRAGSDREAALAGAMARDALTRLADADRLVPQGTDEPVRAVALGVELERAGVSVGVPVPLETDLAVDALDVPGPVARALVQAAAQAIANVVEHAGGRGLTVRLTADADLVRVVVSDTGDGFDARAVPDDRLGIRGSIVARMAAVAGRASIESGAEGTRVALTWEPIP